MAVTSYEDIKVHIWHCGILNIIVTKIFILVTSLQHMLLSQ